MEKSKKSINVEGGFLIFGGWNFLKSVSVDSTFIREMRVPKYKGCQLISIRPFGVIIWTKKKTITF